MRITGIELVDRGERTELSVRSDAEVSGAALLDRRPDARLTRLVEELLIGGDALAIAYHWGRLTAANEKLERALSLEIAALDIAMWDLRARANAEPLWRTLGGLRPQANPHARVPTASREGDALRSWCETTKREGIRGILLGASEDTEADAAALLAIRDCVGDGMEGAFMFDAKERWYPKDAVRAIAALERSIDLTWIEAPVHRSDFLGLKRVSESIRGAVCSGGRLASIADYLPYLKHRSLDIVQIDVRRVGITAALQIADAAYALELPVALTATPGNFAVHLSSVLPYCASVEWSADATNRSNVRIENGWATANDDPGHGLVCADASRGHA